MLINYECARAVILNLSCEDDMSVKPFLHYKLKLQFLILFTNHRLQNNVGNEAVGRKRWLTKFISNRRDNRHKPGWRFCAMRIISTGPLYSANRVESEARRDIAFARWTSRAGDDGLRFHLTVYWSLEFHCEYEWLPGRQVVQDVASFRIHACCRYRPVVNRCTLLFLQNR